MQDIDSNHDDISTCYVCKDKAGKHNYYGGRVCPSCRAFFRRAVQSKYYEIFFCNKGEKCEINLKTRRSCQFCRFKKCLESGMKVTWVLPDEERNRRFNKLAKVKRQQQKAKSPMNPAKQPMMSTTNEEILKIQKVNKFVNTKAYEAFKRKVFGNPQLLKEFLNAGYFGEKISRNFVDSFVSVCSIYVELIFCCAEELSALSNKDKKLLLDKNGPLVNRFKSAMFLDDDESCLCKGLESARISGNFPELEEINTKLRTLGMEGKTKPVIKHDQFFPTSTYEDAVKQKELTAKMKDWARQYPGGPIDDVQSTLMRLVIASSPDFIELERPDLVAKAQLKYATLLQSYLKSKYGLDEARRRFGAGLMIIAHAREANEVIEKRLNEEKVTEIANWEYC